MYPPSNLMETVFCTMYTWFGLSITPTVSLSVAWIHVCFQCIHCVQQCIRAIAACTCLFWVRRVQYMYARVRCVHVILSVYTVLNRVLMLRMSVYALFMLIVCAALLGVDSVYSVYYGVYVCALHVYTVVRLVYTSGYGCIHCL